MCVRYLSMSSEIVKNSHAFPMTTTHPVFAYSSDFFPYGGKHVCTVWWLDAVAFPPEKPRISSLWRGTLDSSSSILRAALVF